MNHQAAHNQPANIAALWRGVQRYGFNGKEVDSEGMGGGSSTYDYGFRIYNAQLGKFLSVDPLCASYPYYTPFQFAGNMPIWAIDLDGLEQAIIVRWYDSSGLWTGNTYISVPNADDRPLGNGNLYINQQGDPKTSNDFIRDLEKASAPVDAGNYNVVNTLINHACSPITDESNNLIEGIAFIRSSEGISDRDKNILDSQLDDINDGQISRTLVLPDVDIIYFDYNSSEYNPNNSGPDISPAAQENGIVYNDCEVSQAKEKLEVDPERQYIVTGNCSTEDIKGVNQNLSAARAVSAVGILIETGVDPNKIVNSVGAGSSNANPDPMLNDRTKVKSPNRNATIRSNIPRASK
ncbi:MAG: RHS repeat-associated core domain-containing protein [Flavobacteriales bacterium]